MKEVSTPREVASGSTENGPMYGLLNKSRRLACTTLAGGALLLTGCGPDNPNNGTGGQTAEGGTGGTGGVGAMGGGGAGGDNPCEGLEFGGLASKKFEPGETGSFAVNFDESHPDAHFNGMKFEMISGDIVTKPSIVGITQVIYDNYQTGYGEIGDVSGIRPYVFDPDEHYILDENGNCTLNVVSINQEAMADPARQPVMESPTGTFATVFKFQNESESMVDYSLQVENTRFTLGSMTTLDSDTDYIMGNSKPVGEPVVTINPDGTLRVDATNVTDEGYDNEVVMNGLSMSIPGVTLVPSGQPGIWDSLNPYSNNTVPASWSGLNEGLTDDTVESVLTLPPAPVISNLAIDCSGGPVQGSCVAGGFVYPANLNVTSASNCVATPEVTAGAGTPGLTTAVLLNGNSGTFEYTTGSQSSNMIKLTVDCDGDGGSDSDFTEFEIQ